MLHQFTTNVNIHPINTEHMLYVVEESLKFKNDIFDIINRFHFWTLDSHKIDSSNNNNNNTHSTQSFSNNNNNNRKSSSILTNTKASYKSICMFKCNIDNKQ